MKKKYLFGWITMFILCLTIVTSCSKDDDDGDGGSTNLFYEVNVDGQTYKGTSPLSFMAMMPIYGNSNLTSTMILPEIKTGDFSIESLIIVHYKANDSFKQYNKVGTYNVKELSVSQQNFDLVIEIEAKSGKYKLEAGTHMVTNVKFIEKDEYIIEGNFTASYKNITTNKTIEVSGKYRTFALVEL